jgi:phage tail sheath gpL-like
MANTIISISHPSPFNLKLDGASRRRNEAVQLVVGFLRGLVAGTQKGTAVTINAGTSTSALAAASGTVTYVTPSGTQTVTVNGVAITATSGASATLTAVAVAAAINASTNALVQYFVTAVPVAGVVTITALQPGITGNAVTLSASGTGATASAARLTGGVGGSNNPVVVTL